MGLVISHSFSQLGWLGGWVVTYLLT